MKTVLCILLVFTLVVPTFGGEKITVDSDDLDSSTLKRVLSKKGSEMGDVRSWVGIGKEVGEAVSGALGAVVDKAEHFGKTDVGRFTMFLVAWKLFGKDILDRALVLLLTTSALVIAVWSYYRTSIPRRMLVKRDKPNKIKEWKVVNDPVDESVADGIYVTRVLHGVFIAFVLLIGGCNMIGGTFR